MRSVRVLWEDQLADATGRRALKTFGPHALLVACLVDDRKVGADAWWSVKQEIDRRVDAFPLKGNGNLANRAQAWIQKGYPSFVVVPDADKLCKLVGLPGDADPEACRGRFAQRCGIEPEGVVRAEVRPLVENLETLVEIASDLMEELPPAKDRIERDTRLGRVSHASSDVRGKLRIRMPSFDELVRTVAKLLADESVPPG